MDNANRLRTDPGPNANPDGMRERVGMITRSAIQSTLMARK